MKIIEIATNLWSLESNIGVLYFNGSRKKIENYLKISIEGKGIKNNVDVDETIFAKCLMNSEFLNSLEYDKKTENNITKEIRKIKLKKNDR